jgi:23S rRNA (guanosine2251-2'-O)-methyltransferase
VLGAEGRGIRPGIARHVDTPVAIPMAGSVASLNVSAAAAVILYEWVRRGLTRPR